MTLPVNGELTVSMINIELGRAADAVFNILGDEERELADVSSGQINWSDFYGKTAPTAPTVLSLTVRISSTSNGDLMEFDSTYDQGTPDGFTFKWEVSYNSGAWSEAGFTSKFINYASIICNSPLNRGFGTLSVRLTMTNDKGSSSLFRNVTFKTLDDLTHTEIVPTGFGDRIFEFETNGKVDFHFPDKIIGNAFGVSGRSGQYEWQVAATNFPYFPSSPFNVPIGTWGNSKIYAGFSSNNLTAGQTGNVSIKVRNKSFHSETIQYFLNITVA